MSYANATPKPLKFLVRNGNLVDENGNVLAHSDSLKDMYDKACPEVKKYLLSDGSVVDEDNNLIIKNDYFKKVYDQAVPKVAKYLHSDGTIDENPSGGSGADLENNHQATIDVSTYTNPVEITPTQGKDGMKKATVTVTNIPQAGAMLYGWFDNYGGIVYLNIDTAPTEANDIKTARITAGIVEIDSLLEEGDTYTKISDTEFSVNGETFTRRSTENDVSVWG